jgi:hypothetical protein
MDNPHVQQRAPVLCVMQPRSLSAAAAAMAHRLRRLRANGHLEAN